MTYSHAESVFRSHSLLISSFGRTGGGLFLFCGERVITLDRIGTTGVCCLAGTVARVMPMRVGDAWLCRILTYTPDGIRVTPPMPGVVGPHDIAPKADAGWLVASSGTNAICSVTRDGSVEEFWRGSGEADSWHINCLTLLDGRLIASAFGTFLGQREWDPHKREGTGVVFYVDTGADLLTGLSCPHHPRLLDDELLVCNSARGEIVGFDRHFVAERRRLRFRGWTRGLAVTPDYLFVGVSAFREHATPAGLASIEIVRRRDWNHLSSIPMPCSEIYDLVMVPRAMTSQLAQVIQDTTLQAGPAYRKQNDKHIATG